MRVKATIVAEYEVKEEDYFLPKENQKKHILDFEHQLLVEAVGNAIDSNDDSEQVTVKVEEVE